MAETVTCIEAEGRPPRVNLALPPEGQDFLVWLLPDALEGAGPLRNTILRRDDEDPPAGSLLVLWVDVQVLGPNRMATRVRRIGPEVTLYLKDGDNWRELAPGTALPPSGDFEVALPTLRRVRFSLRREAAGDAGMRTALAGSGTSKPQQKAANRGALWLIPTLKALAGDWRQLIMRNVWALLKRLGIGPQTSQMIFIFGGMALAAGVVFYMQYKAKAEAEARAAAAEDAMGKADAAREAALLGEMSCLSERQALAEKLGEIEIQRMLLVENVLDITDARSASVDIAGTRMRGDDLMANDVAIVDHMKRYAVSLMAAVPPVSPEDANPCLDQDALLGEDLPRYALMWHPDPEMVCPLSYVGLLEGLTLAGRWGLSPRVSTEFGRAEPALQQSNPGSPLAELMSDPRMNDRWSADTMANGLRSVQEALLSFDLEGRPSVTPSQSQAWSLALFAAINRLPSMADGVLNEPASYCVNQLLTEYAANAPASQKGEPLLPDLVDVATGVVELKVRPSPACPWAPDALQKGGQATFTAVARLALVEEGGADKSKLVP